MATDLDNTSRPILNYYRAWLEEHLGMPIYVIPAGEYVRACRDNWREPDSIFFREDGFHLRTDHAITRGLSYLTKFFLTGVVPDYLVEDLGAANAEAVELDRFVHHEAQRAVYKTRYAGFEGFGRGESLDIEDPLPNPLDRDGQPGEPEPSGLPAFLLAATPDGYTGPALSSPPEWVDGAWAVPQTGSTGTELTTSEGWRTQIGMVAIVRMSALPAGQGRPPLIGLRHSDQPGWTGDRFALMYNNFFPTPLYQSDTGAESVDAGAVVDDWQIVSVYHDGEAVGGWTGDGSPNLRTTPAPEYAPEIRISGQIGDGDSGFGIALRGLWIWTSNGTLTDELAAVRALAATYMPG